MGQAKMDLTLKHPDFDATEALRIKARDLFEGGETVREKRDAYLIKGKNEGDEDFDRRLARAVLDPWVEKIVRARQALLFAKKHTRNLPAALDTLSSDVDRKGTPADVFFHDIAREAQVDGLRWVAVDLPRMPVDDAGRPLLKTARDEAAAGMRPFFESVPASAVIDWEVGPDRQLLWAVVVQEDPSPRDEQGWGFAPGVVPRWKIWTRTAWYLYQEAEKSTAEAPNARDRYTLVEEGTHPFGAVPLVPFFGVKRTDYSGWPVCRSVLGHVLQIYNKESDLDWFEHLSAHPIPYTIGKERPSKIDAGRGLHLKSEQGFSTSIGYLETSGNGFSSLRASIADLRARIYAIALAQAQKDSAQVQSAEGQREDRRIFAADLKTAATLLEASELHCWQIMARWKAAPTAAGEKIEVVYNRDFDDRVIEAAMIAEFRNLAVSEMLPVDDVLQLLVDGGLLPPEYDIDAAKAKIQGDIARRGFGTGGVEHQEGSTGNTREPDQS